MVPMTVEAAAASLAGEVAVTHPRTVLETAADTGAPTRALLRACRDAMVTATDLNPPMLERAAVRTGKEPRVTWQQAHTRSTCRSTTTSSTPSPASSG